MRASICIVRERSATFWIRSLLSLDAATVFPVPRLSRRILHHPLVHYLLLYWSYDITSALHLQGACTRRGVGVALYTITRERHDKPRRGGQKVDTMGEGYASRRPVLSWIDRYIDALSRPESVDLSLPIVFGASGELMGRLRSVVHERD